MRIVGQKNGGIVATLAAGAIMAQLGATRVVAESSAHKATTSKAGIEGVTFHDLRGTAVTRLALAGATSKRTGLI
jgi:integrase